MVNKTPVGPGWQRAIITQTGTVITVVVILALYWAQAVFIPVALAGFLTFLLSPMVGWFRQRGMPRTPAVLLVVLVTALGLGLTMVLMFISFLVERAEQTVLERVDATVEAELGHRFARAGAADHAPLLEAVEAADAEEGLAQDEERPRVAGLRDEAFDRIDVRADGRPGGPPTHVACFSIVTHGSLRFDSYAREARTQHA